MAVVVLEDGGVMSGVVVEDQPGSRAEGGALVVVTEGVAVGASWAK